MLNNNEVKGSVSPWQKEWRPRISCPVLETACEENAFITEHANKGQPKIDNFFEMADPFAKEDDMLDISDTIFDVANEFPDIYLRGRLVAPSKSEFKIIV
ncbi:hypothetical protein COOONC_12031, partial [Cooperia oncophora]